MTDKIDFKKSLDSYRAPRGGFRILDIPDMRYLMVDGHGDPNTTPAYTEAISALYPVAYKLKFLSKRELERDYVVPPLEGLWWANEVRLETLSEGRCVQTLHHGSFDDEGPVLKRMHSEFIPDNGLRLDGKHHEVYFSDFRKVTPDKLRTLLRQPVRPVSG